MQRVSASGWAQTLALAAILATAIVVVPSVEGREIASAKPERHGFDSERLGKLTDSMNARVADGTMAGGLGLIARNGRIVYQQTYGFADREARREMATDAVFRIYSMTKPITGVALMMLYEEGKFALNDPVARYLPEMANLRVALSTTGTAMQSDGTTSRTIGEGDKSLLGQTRKPSRQPTIRDLLTHTAGLTYGIFGNTEVDQLYREQGIMTQDVDLAEFVKTLGTLPLQYEPGSQWHYSVAVDVQGRLVEVLAGMKFSEFLQRRLLRPLDMPDTDFQVTAANRDRLAQLYRPKGQDSLNFLARSTGPGLEVADASTSKRFIEGGKFESGGGGLVSTARDYLRFCQMLLNGGELDGVRILSPKTVQLMTANHLGDLPMGWGRRGAGFGLGFGLVTDAGRYGEIASAGEYNWGGAAGTAFWVDPAEEMIAIFMVQSIPHRTRLRSEFRNLVYQAMVETYQD